MRKIDIYIGGVYTCSTTQRTSLAEAKREFLKSPTYAGMRPDGSLGMVQAPTDQTVTVQWADR